MTMKIEVNGHLVEVDDSFGSLSPEAQQAQVNEIASLLPKTEQEKKAEEKVATELYSTPGVAALGGAAVGMIDQALGQPIESLAARQTGAQKIVNPATGEHAGWKWARKTGFGAGLDPTVEGQSSEFQKREAEGKFKEKHGQKKPIPGKALTLEKHLQNVARDEMEARVKAQVAARQTPGYTSTKPTSFMGKGLGLGGRMLAGAGAAGMGMEAYDEGARALERFKAGDIGGAARAGRGALLNALGAAGSAATYVPHPLVRGIGTAVGLGAPALNMMLEKAGYARGGLAHLEDGGKTPKGGSPKKMVAELLIGRAPRAIKDILESKQAPNPTKTVRPSEALGPHADKYLYVTESDRMRSTGGDLGGPGFSKFQLEDPRYAQAQAAWGVGKKGKASEILNINKRFPEDKIIWSPLIGSESQHRSNQHVYDMLTNEFSRQASMGKLSPELREAMNQRLANFPKYEKAKLAGLDVANPEHLKQMGNTFDRRAAISEVIGGKGVGGREGQIFDYPGIMQEMTDPMVVGAPTHSVGTRLFSLTGDVDYRPDLHSAFPYILKGEDKGVQFNRPVPKELMFGNWTEQVRDFLGREPGPMDYLRGVKEGHGRPNAFLSQELLRKLEDAGYKKGGLTHLK